MHCGRATRSYGVVLCAALLASPALVNGGGPVEPSRERSAVPITEQEFVDSVNEEFSLRESSLFTLEVSATAGTTIRMTVPIEGRQRTMVLKQHSIRAPGYQLLMQVADGSLVSVEPGPERTLRGVVEDVRHWKMLACGRLFDGRTESSIGSSRSPARWWPRFRGSM